MVHRERAQLRRLQLVSSACLLVACTCALLAIGAVGLGAARWLFAPRATPFLVWLAVLAADAFVFAWTVRALSARTNARNVAAAIEREHKLRRGALQGALEVEHSGALGRHAAGQVAEQLNASGTRGSMAPQTMRVATRAMQGTAAIALIAVAALGWTAPVYRDGLTAVLRPVRAWKGTLLPRLSFRDLPPVVLRGEPLTLQVNAPGRTDITVTSRTPGEAWSTRDVAVNPRTHLARLELGSIAGEVTLVASDGRSESDTARVGVTDRPFVGAVSMRAVYPAYLGRPPEGLPIGEPARVPQGTVVEIAGRASTVLEGVALVNARDTVRFQVHDRAFAGTMQTRATGHWTWSARSASGPIADVPLPIDLEIVADSAPQVQLVSPAMDTVVAEADRVALHAIATDDHGLARVDLVTWIGAANAGAGPTTSSVAPNGSTVWEGSPVLDLGALGLKPGDALHAKFVATDNSPWAQRGESRELVLRVPTMEEQRELARDAADSAVSRAVQTAAAQQALAQKTSEAARSRDQQQAASQNAAPGAAGGDSAGALSYDAAQKSQALAKEQRALTDQVKQLQHAADTVAQQLQRAGALDSSLARQLQDAQNLLRDALTPELLAQMDKLQNASQQLSKEQAQKALQNLAAMQEQLRQQLEKSAEMLKRAAIEGSMQTLADQAKEIAQREQAMADSARPQSSDSSRAQAQHLADQSQHLTDAMQKLEQQLNDAKANAGAQRTQQAQQHANASEQSMRAAAGQPRNGTQQQSGSQQQAGSQQQNGSQQKSGSQQQSASAAASQMQQAASDMQQARSDQVGAWKQELTGALDRSIQEMLQMARQEHALEQQARSSQSNPTDMRGAQSAVKQGVDQTAERLQREGQKSSLLSGRSQRAMADAQDKVSQALQQTTPRSDQEQTASQSQTAGSLAQAADALNQAAASLARDRERVNTASSASGFSDMLQEMQDMAKRQGSINSQAQGIMPGPGGPPSLTPEMQATQRALARQQRQIAQELDDLGDGPGGDRAAQLAKEAKQVADAMDGGREDATTLARQQQLFRRLLDAGRTLEKDEREDNGKREAQSATGDNAFAPTNTNATGQAASRFRAPTWDELRGLSADDRRAILDYFKRINAPKP